VNNNPPHTPHSQRERKLVDYENKKEEEEEEANTRPKSIEFN